MGPNAWDPIPPMERALLESLANCRVVEGTLYQQIPYLQIQLLLASGEGGFKDVHAGELKTRSMDK